MTSSDTETDPSVGGSEGQGSVNQDKVSEGLSDTVMSGRSNSHKTTYITPLRGYIMRVLRVYKSFKLLFCL